MHWILQGSDERFMDFVKQSLVFKSKHPKTRRFHLLTRVGASGDRGGQVGARWERVGTGGTKWERASEFQRPLFHLYNHDGTFQVQNHQGEHVNHDTLSSQRFRVSYSVFKMDFPERNFISFQIISQICSGYGISRIATNLFSLNEKVCIA